MGVKEAILLYQEEESREDTRFLKKKKKKNKVRYMNRAEIEGMRKREQLSAQEFNIINLMQESGPRPASIDETCIHFNLRARPVAWIDRKANCAYVRTAGLSEAKVRLIEGALAEHYGNIQRY
jgi:hypothetical protein